MSLNLSFLLNATSVLGMLTMVACQSSNQLPFTPDETKPANSRLVSETAAATTPAPTTANQKQNKVIADTIPTTNAPANAPKHLRRDFRFVEKLNQKANIGAGDIHEYTFKGRGGQKIEVKLESKNEGLFFDLLRPDEQHLVSHQKAWSGTLPANGSYIARLQLPAQAKPKQADYRITINPEELKQSAPSREDLLRKGGFK